MKIRKNDTVKVLYGKDKGKVGAVLRVLPKKDRLVVEGVNIITKHVKKSAQAQEGGIVKREAAIHVSNVQVMSKKLNRPVKIGIRVEGNKRVRYDKKSKETLERVKKSKEAKVSKEVTQEGK